MRRSQKSTKVWKGTVAAMAALGLVVATPLAANAVVAKEGSRICASSAPNSWVKGTGSGTLSMRPPGSNSIAYRNVGSWGTASVPGAYGGGYWRVASDGGSLNDPGTYAWCTSAS